MAEKAGTLAKWMRPDSRSRRLILAALVYVIAAGVFAAVAGPQRLGEHTQYNHYALLADAWLHGRWDLPTGPPPYAMNNDFVSFEGKTYISFPPLPAMLMLPLVKLSGNPENFRDGQFVIWLAALCPAFVFLVLEKLRRTGRSPRSEVQNSLLSLLFAFGTVYFFAAVEGTVWFAALVVAAAASALYVLFALDAEHPVLAGAMIGCLYLSRPPAVWMALLFALEALRVSIDGELPTEGTWLARARSILERLKWRDLARRYALFWVPILCAFAFVAWANHVRYHRASPFYFDHEYLTVAWRARMEKWGMINYHFLAKNLGVAFTSLPWLPARGERMAFGTPFKVNEHGLALWFTTPVFIWLLWPKRFDGEPQRKWLYVVAALSAALPALMDLLYQNTGWRQFGYRFSIDYAVLLFVLLAICARPMKKLFWAAAVWGVAWNLFGALTFDHSQFQRFYFSDGSQTIVYQPD
ncbi:MAG TPA: hypothetical protein VMI75_36740 [Polyangiaceae bacterium]|nr:hypothetical protein [Polyangiaceae bacterium]